jgi:AcrR family transcriptional regulator
LIVGVGAGADVARFLLVTSAPTPRRLGATDSKTRAQLLEAAEDLLFEEGYAAVTSRRVAAKAGLKPQLVHYYFRTMDDLFLEVFRRRAEENLARFERAIAADGSLRNLWRLNADPRGTAFASEFVSLAKHRRAIRSEIAHFAQRFRDVQIAAMRDALAHHGVPEDALDPEAAVMAMTGIAQVLALEDALGVTTGHEAARVLVEHLITRLEAGEAC